VSLRNAGGQVYEQVVLYDGDGRLLYRQQQRLSAQEEVSLWLPADMPSGIYAVELRRADGSRLLKRLAVVRP
jgi:hypothetical protein